MYHRSQVARLHKPVYCGSEDMKVGLYTQQENMSFGERSSLDYYVHKISEDVKQTDGINYEVWVIIDFITKITNDDSHYLFDLDFMEVMLAIFSLVIRVFKLFNDINDFHIDGVLEDDKPQLDIEPYQGIVLLVKEKTIKKINIQKLLSIYDTEYSFNISVKTKGPTKCNI